MKSSNLLHYLPARILGWTALVLATTLAAPPAFGDGAVKLPGVVQDFGDLVRERLDLEAAYIRDLDLPGREWMDFTLEVELGSVRHTLELAPHSVRSWDFRLLVQDESGALEEEEAPAPATYIGSVQGVPGSEAAVSLIDGRLKGVIVLDPGEVWFVQPLSDAVEEAPGTAHVFFRSREVTGRRWNCGTDALPPLGDAECECEPDGIDGGMTLLGTGFKICEIAFDTDVEFYQKNGSSVANTLHDIENVMVQMRVIYERDVDITYEVTAIIVRTAEPDPYSSTDPGALLNQFRSHWNSSKGAVKRDTAHLMTGKNLDGSVIGVAWVGVICVKNSAYGLSQSKFSGNLNNRVALTAHEVGHNWNAGHCTGSTCHIMCAGLGGCGGIGLPDFGPVSINAITNFKNSRTCLDDLGDPVAPPFFDDFPTTNLNRDLWPHKNGAVVNANAVNEPSPPNALNLDASGAGEFADDEVRSNFILLGGLGTVELSYHTQHRGVENGEELVVDFWTDNLSWQEINRITSDGVDQNDFAFHQHTLPANALHDEFRVRFRTEVDEANDDWYIDDVHVEAGQLPDPPTISAITPKAGIEQGFTPVTITGTNFTTVPAMTVTLDGSLLGFQNVVNATTITGLTPSGTNGFVDVTVSSAAGSDTLVEGYRYFPILGDPFNATDIKTDSVNAPEDVVIIFTGQANTPFTAFLSFGGGPLPTPYGIMGLDFPIILLLAAPLNFQGFSLLPLGLPAGLGPLDFYIHALSEDAGGNLLWAFGGNNPNGSGSVWIHLNN